MRPIVLILTALALIPSALFVAANADLPRFGSNHDEALYFVGAKSLTDGGGYRIASLPGEPAQTKYPPLYPALLSPAWLAGGGFPGNLALAVWINWLAIPLIAFQLAWWFPSLGFSQRWTAVLAALFALNPYIVLAGTQLLSELWFVAILLASVIALERASGDEGSWRLALLAGVLGGLAYLTRTAGLMLLPAAVVYLWMRKQVRVSGVFAAAMLPLVAGWMLWARAHQTPTDDPALLYYLDYVRYQLYAVSLTDAPVLLWKNADGLLWSLGALIIPKVTSSLPVKIVSQVVAVAMISGAVRLWRQGEGRPMALFSVFSAALLLVWHYPPREGLVLPMFPLALAGLAVEARHFYGLLSAARGHRDRSQRVVAGGMMAAASLGALFVLGLQAYLDTSYLPEDARAHRVKKADRVASWGWLRDNVPEDAAVLSPADPAVYLYTGRHAMRKTLPPFLWYREDRKAMVNWFADVEPFAREHGLTHFDFAGVDAAEGLEDEDREAVAKRVREDEGLMRLFAQGEAGIYGFRRGHPVPGPLMVPNKGADPFSDAGEGF